MTRRRRFCTTGARLYSEVARRCKSALPVAVAIMVAAPGADANGVYRNGAGARAMAAGGVATAWPHDALSAMASNPAGLARIDRRELRAGAVIAKVDGEFSNAANEDADSETGIGIIPEAAAALPLPGGRVSFGVALSPLVALEADWRYVDAPGGAGGVSYGLQRHRARLIAVRGALAAAAELGPRLSIGGTLGVVYNRNDLTAPYIFQSQPLLRGAKTLLDLQTDGIGGNGTIGLLFRPGDALDLGVAYTTRTVIDSEGDARGDIGLQIGIPAAPFRYDAEVQVVLPRMLSAGLSWRVGPDLRLSVQTDWIDWSDAFDRLAIGLRNGSNAVLNALIGASAIDDVAPLDWRDAIVYRVGGEYDRSDRWTLRAGYSYGGSPVPDRTLTPLTAAVFEHTLTAGAGYRGTRWQVDVAYQWDLPARRRVGDSVLLAGEYDNSEVDVAVHWLAVTFGWL